MKEAGKQESAPNGEREPDIQVPSRAPGGTRQPGLLTLDVIISFPSYLSLFFPPLG